MNPTNSFSEAARRAFDNLSLELHRSTEDDNFAEELEKFLKIMDNNDVDEEEFYKCLEFEHEDTSARNYSTRVIFDDHDDIIELANYLTEIEFSASDQEPTLKRQSEYGFLRSSATYHPKSR
jgi:hypothetical protein